MANANIRFAFNGKDQDEYEFLFLRHSGTATAPTGVRVSDGGTRTTVAGSGTPGNMPTPGSGDIIWYRIVSDGAGGVTVWCKQAATLPGSWSDSTDKVFESSNFHEGVFASGGMIGFMGSAQTAYVDDFKLTIDTTGNGTPDTVAHKDDFELDGGYAILIDAVDFSAHDAAGNLIWDGVHKYTYDAWNRLTKIEKAYRDPDDSYNLVAAYTVSEMQYDGLHARIVKAASNSADLDATYHYYYDQWWRIIEERNGSGLVIRQNVWGEEYIDELIQIAINGDPIEDPDFDPEDPDHDPRYYFAQHDANFNVLGIVDDEGALVERYEYTPYGQRTVYFSAGPNDAGAHAATVMSRRVALVGGAIAPYGINPIGHQGLHHDEATGLIQNRNRDLHPRFGRFMQNDYLEYVDGLNRFVAYHVMWGAVDPEGLSSSMYASNSMRMHHTLGGLGGGGGGGGGMRPLPTGGGGAAGATGSVRIISHPTQHAARRAADRQAGHGRHGGRITREEPLRPGSQSPQGDPGRRTEITSTDTGMTAHHDPFGHNFPNGYGCRITIGPHYGVDTPGGTTHHTYPSSHNPQTNR